MRNILCFLNVNNGIDIYPVVHFDEIFCLSLHSLQDYYLGHLKILAIDTQNL